MSGSNDLLAKFGIAKITYTPPPDAMGIVGAEVVIFQKERTMEEVKARLAEIDATITTLQNLKDQYIANGKRLIANADSEEKASDYRAKKEDFVARHRETIEKLNAERDVLLAQVPVSADAVTVSPEGIKSEEAVRGI